MPSRHRSVAAPEIGNIDVGGVKKRGRGCLSDIKICRQFLSARTDTDRFLDAKGPQHSGIGLDAISVHHRARIGTNHKQPNIIVACLLTALANLLDEVVGDTSAGKVSVSSSRAIVRFDALWWTKGAKYGLLSEKAAMYAATSSNICSKMANWRPNDIYFTHQSKHVLTRRES